jgi:SAM-dependent methyltransferase
MSQAYVFNNAWQRERLRLDALEAIWDPYSRRNIEALGAGEGWHCLEVGAGGGSIAAWLCTIVGPRGRVVATDVDVRHLQPLADAALEIRRHDITVDDIEAEAFDLVHARLLLEHLPARDEALRRMYQALRPGGWLLLEEFDHVSLMPDPASGADAIALWDAWTRAFERLSEGHGLDLTFGRRLAGLLDALGLQDVTANGRTVTERGGNDQRALLRLSVEQLRDDLVATGEMDQTQVDGFIALLRDPEFRWMSQLMIAAHGRRPER